MKKVVGKTTSLLILISITGLIMFTFYGKVLLSPNQYLMSNDGDGVKNYFTFIYHIRHDTSKTYFSGMNYPHKELHIFTDGSHPLSVFLKQFSNTALVKDKEVAWLNLFTLLSVFPCVVCIWLVLGRLKIADWISIIGAISITFLAPQWSRLSGHFSLALLFALPLTIYLLMRFLEDRGKVVGLVISSVAYFLFLIFTHVYLGVLCMSFYLLATIFYFLFSRDKREIRNRLLSSLMSVALPLLIFACYLWIFDSVSDRPENPGGVMHYLSSVKSVLLPNFGLIKSQAAKLFDLSGRAWEGLSYVGLISVLVLFANIVIFILSRSGVSSLKKWKPKLPLFLSVSLLSGFILLLLSFGVFHNILGEKLSFLLGPFRQIRGLGRFAWTFYFPCLIFVFYSLDFWLNKLRSFQLRIAIGALVAFVFALEWWPYQDYVSEDRAKLKNYFNSSLIAEGENQRISSLHDLYKEIDTSDYQTIFPLPFYIVGGEYFNINIKEGVLPPSVALSTWSGLPLMSSAMSRTSLQLVKDRIQLLVNPVYKKKNQSDLFDNREILLLISKESELRDHSEWLLSASRPVAENSNFEFRAISPAEFFEAENYQKEEQKAAEDERHEESIEKDEGPIFWEPFLSAQCESACLPPGGAFEGRKKSYHKVVEFDPGTFKENISYTASFWLYNAFPEKKEFFLIEEKTPDGDLNGWRDIAGLSDTPYVWGDWSVVEKEFEVTNSESQVSLLVSNFSSRYPLVVDNVLIRKSDEVVFRKMPDSTMLMNNLPLSK